jgi:hypothetical protein
MHPLFLLAIGTFVLVVAFLAYVKISHSRHRQGKVEGIGGENDPISGTTNRVRDPDELRASLDGALGYRGGAQPVDARRST